MNHRRLLLVIDDEEIVREAIEDILESVNIAVISAADGYEGISLFKQHQSEIKGILLDMKMPGLSGSETLKQLRTIDPNITVILSSGYSEEETRRSLANQMPIRFLPKPYNFDTLVENVKKVMDEDEDESTEVQAAREL